MNERIGIIGPRRAEMGIGEYTAKYLLRHGARITSLVASTLDSGLRSAAQLHKKYGVVARVYETAEQMLRSGDIEVIAICTPSSTHAVLLDLAANVPVHVFCEKPLVWNNGDLNTEKSIDIIRSFVASGYVIHCNTQWPFTLPYYEQLHGIIQKGSINSFYMQLAPASSDPWIMIQESAPHANSVLLALGSSGSIKNCRIDIAGDDIKKEHRVSIKFDSIGALGQMIRVSYEFINVAYSPRPVCYAINQKFAHRGLMDNYRFFFHDDSGNRIDVDDPLELSVMEFLKKIRNTERYDRKIHDSGVIANMKMLTHLYKVYYDVKNRKHSRV